jgi:pSer/pThr/pTyr-binding forkhead associated (FHA) protein
MSRNETRIIERPIEADLKNPFLAKHRAILVVMSGQAAGVEHELTGSDIICGRGPGVDITLTDDSMSRAHATLELGAKGFRVRDLGSTNGLRVNGSDVQTAELKHGDRIEMGEHELQYVVEKRSHQPRTYILPEE